ncbi:protein FAM168A isoform X11 [Caretta caretta]|uniref:protein FAM168A isoform X11 n=1 Tax=Caretta caretta TaxID=8467 RepID=UPI003F4C6D18
METLRTWLTQAVYNVHPPGPVLSQMQHWLVGPCHPESSSFSSLFGSGVERETLKATMAAAAGYPTGYHTAAPAYNPNMYPTSSPGYAPGYTAGTPYKVPPTQSNSAPPPYSPSPNPYQTAMYPIRSAYPQQNLYAQGAYYTQPVYAAQPHVIHHTTVVQPNSIPSAIYPAPVAAPRTNGVAMGMVAGTTMAMSAGTLLTTPQHTAIGAHPVSVPTYRAQGAPTYSYVPPHW